MTDYSCRVTSLDQVSSKYSAVCAVGVTFWERHTIQCLKRQLWLNFHTGVPIPNGTRHASEIAYLALDIVAMVRHRALIMPRMNLPVQLLLGVNTGELLPSTSNSNKFFFLFKEQHLCLFTFVFLSDRLYSFIHIVSTLLFTMSVTMTKIGTVNLRRGCVKTVTHSLCSDQMPKAPCEYGDVDMEVILMTMTQVVMHVLFTFFVHFRIFVGRRRGHGDVEILFVRGHRQHCVAHALIQPT